MACLTDSIVKNSHRLWESASGLQFNLIGEPSIYTAFHKNVHTIEKNILFCKKLYTDRKFFARLIVCPISSLSDYCSDATFQHNRQVQIFSNLVDGNAFVQRTVKHSIKVHVWIFGCFNVREFRILRLFFFREILMKHIVTHQPTLIDRK